MKTTSQEWAFLLTAAPERYDRDGLKVRAQAVMIEPEDGKPRNGISEPLAELVASAVVWRTIGGASLRAGYEPIGGTIELDRAAAMAATLKRVQAGLARDERDLGIDPTEPATYILGVARALGIKQFVRYDGEPSGSYPTSSFTFMSARDVREWIEARIHDFKA